MIPYLTPIYDEGWRAGTYVRSGIVFLSGEGLKAESISADSMEIYRKMKRETRAFWPRPISGYFSIPIYIHSDFDGRTSEWVKRRQPLHWAIWQEPILYSPNENSITLRSDYGKFGSAFFGYLNERFNLAMNTLAKHFDITEQINKKT